MKKIVKDIILLQQLCKKIDSHNEAKKIADELFNILKNIIVTADNHKKQLDFGPSNMLECICIQHEICHLNGETMFNYKI